MKEYLESDEFLGRLARLQVLAKKILRIESTSERADAAGSATAEFAAHRSYAAGDDTRYLDWNVYARLDELFIKRFKPEENINFVVLLDSSASFAGEHSPKFRAAAQLAAALAYIGVSNFDNSSVSMLA